MFNPREEPDYQSSRFHANAGQLLTEKVQAPGHVTSREGERYTGTFVSNQTSPKDNNRAHTSKKASSKRKRVERVEIKNAD